MMTTKPTDRRIFRLVSVLILALAMLVPLVSVQSASAQDASKDGFTDDFTFESLFGYTLTWDDSWEIDNEGSGFYETELADSLYFTQDHGVSSFSLVALPSIGSVISSLGYYTEYYRTVLDSPELIETGADKRGGASLIRFESDNVAYGLYIRVFLDAGMSTELQAVVVGELETFDTLLESVQETIGFNGDPILGELDPADTLALLEDGEAIPFPTPRGQTTPDEEEDSDDPSENEDIKLPEDDDPTEEPEDVDPDATEEDDAAEPEPTEEVDDAEPEPTEEDTETGDDVSNLGLVEDGVYQSPQFGVELEWSSDWEVDTDTLGSDEDFGVDQLAMISTDLDASFYLTMYSLDSLTPSEWTTQFEDLVENGDQGLEILEQDVVDNVETFLYSFEFEGEVGYGIVEVYADQANDALIIVEISGTEESLEEAFASAQIEIELNGDQPFIVTEEVPQIP
ncbi:MAG: hypothetical protein WKF81_03860 [Thermomicrobiales bacterium]